MGNNKNIKNMKYSFVIAALVGAMSQVDLAEATAVARHHHHHHQSFVQGDDKEEEGKDVEQSKKEAAAAEEEEQAKGEAKVVKEFKDKLNKAKAKNAEKEGAKKAAKAAPVKTKVNDELWTASLPEKYFGMTHVEMRNVEESESESDSDSD